jgi:hypothetical protein
LAAAGLWVSADAATDFTDTGVLGLLNSLEAVDATRAEVCSFEGFLDAIEISLSGLQRGKEQGPKYEPLPERDQTNSSI